MQYDAIMLSFRIQIQYDWISVNKSFLKLAIDSELVYSSIAVFLFFSDHLSIDNDKWWLQGQIFWAALPLHEFSTIISLNSVILNVDGVFTRQKTLVLQFFFCFLAITFA